MYRIKFALVALFSVLLLLTASSLDAVAAKNTHQSSQQTIAERHDCGTFPPGSDGTCINYGHRYVPKYTSSGYIHDCWTPPGGNTQYFLAIFTFFVGHETIWKLRPLPKEGRSFHSPQEKGVWRTWTNDQTMSDPDIVWETQMINDADPPGTSWTYEVDQYCIESCGCKMDAVHTHQVLKFFKARYAILHPSA